MGGFEVRREAEARRISVPTEATERSLMKSEAVAPLEAHRLTVDTPKAGLFSRLLDHGMSAAEHTLGGLHKAQGAVASLRHDLAGQHSLSGKLGALKSGAEKALTEKVAESLALTPIATHVTTGAAVNHDREAPQRPVVNITLFQVNVTNEKGPGLASQVVTSVAGAAASLASARAAMHGETQADAPKASGLGAQALRLAFGAAKSGAALIAKQLNK